MTPGVDDAVVQFSPASLVVLNFALGFLVFAVALFIEARDFRTLLDRPRSLAVGLASQWLLLPGLTLALIAVLQPHPGLALGMLLVAACPGGNVSNYFCLLARANVVLSIALTTVATLAAALMTPTLFALGARLAASALELPGLEVDLAAMLQSVLWIIVLPLTLGLAFRARFPAFAGRIRRPMRVAAGVVLLAFIAVALVNNRATFQGYVGAVAGLVVLHNGLAFAGGYLLAALCGLTEAERRTVSIETGIQNSGLGLVLIFNFFGGSGPMALVAAGWGLWHLVSGGLLSMWWSRRSPAAPRLVEERA